MTEPHFTEDHALRYTLGELSDAEQRSFEARLEQSAELRESVRQLRSGATALTLAAPQRQPPPHVWRRIEDTVGRETKQETPVRSFWPAWLQNGWAAAAAVLVGWLAYAVWVNRPASSIEPGNVAYRTNARNETARSRDPGDKTTEAVPLVSETTTNESAAAQSSLATLGQISGLRRQVADLEWEVTQLGRALTQQQAILAEPSRMKFFQLTPAGFNGDIGNMTVPSPAVQQALLMAVARELGWVDPGMTNGAGVNFVELPAHRKDESPVTQSATTVTQQKEPEPPDLLRSGEGQFAPAPPTIAGYVATGAGGIQEIVLALDSTVVPAGVSLIDVWGALDSLGVSANGNNLQYLGAFSLANGPSVLTVQGVNSIGLSFGNNYLLGPTNFSNPVPSIPWNNSR